MAMTYRIVVNRDMQELGYAKKGPSSPEWCLHGAKWSQYSGVVRNSNGQEKATIAKVSALAKINEAKLISLTRSAISRASLMSGG